MRGRLRLVWSTLAAAALTTLAAAGLRGQPRPSRALASLDWWIVSRYRGAQLLPDTLPTAPVMTAATLAPRIEAVRDAASGDSLWAVHFSETARAAVLGDGAIVRLAGPTGTITPLTARVVVRRPFRAPRVPGLTAADTARASAWRYGWAYLAVRSPDARRSAAAGDAARYRGWLLLGAPEMAGPSRPRPSR